MSEPSEPVYLSIRADIINAPKDLQAIVAIEQIVKHLQLTPLEAAAVLKFMAERAASPF